jgi:Zn-dependent peptidase ImmA (M78 family)
VDSDLTIETDWEHSEAGTPEERASFAAVGIRSGDLWLTEAEDAFVNRIRQKVYLSAYPLAEWLAWNWWRLRWEPRRHSHEWAMAHRMSTIGGGYVWPDITVNSDGERLVLIPAPTRPRPAEPLRYICQTPAVVRASIFEDAVDALVLRVLGQLRAESVVTSNLTSIWTDLIQERRSPELALRRKFEALLGYEVDEANDDLIERLVRDSIPLGERGVQELAAARTDNAGPATSAEIQQSAKDSGFESRARDVVRLRGISAEPLPVGVAAWKRGVAAARAVREQERLSEGEISSARLCELAGVSNAAISQGQKRGFLSFALDEGPTKGLVVMRSGYETGRRFDLARLLGDRIAAASDGALRPATRTYTYRQKLQRSFAGEFLCPFESLVGMLAGDYSDDMIEDVARHFNVSVLTVRTLLVNHGLIERESLTDDFDVRAYAPRAA